MPNPQTVQTHNSLHISSLDVSNGALTSSIIIGEADASTKRLQTKSPTQTFQIGNKIALRH